jgi:hypothetical protein
MQPVVRYAQNASSHDGADKRRPWPPQETIEWLTAFVRVPPATDPSAIAAALTAHFDFRLGQPASGPDCRQRAGLRFHGGRAAGD